MSVRRVPKASKDRSDPPGQRVPPALPARRVLPERLGMSVPKVPKASKVRPDPLVRQAHRVPSVPLDRWARSDLQVRRATQVRKARQVPLARKVPQARPEPLVR